MKNAKSIKEIIDNNVITKSERMPELYTVGASIARPHFEEHAKENVEAILITRRPQRNSLKYNQSGITLIALIVTIIVLLILASITINLTLGERGIFNTAKKAVENYKDAEERELVDLTNFEEEAENIINEIEKGNIITTKPENKEGKIGISFTGGTTTTSLPVTIKAKISNIENSDVNLSNSKWVLNDNPNKIGTDSSLYTGSFTEENEAEIEINEAKEYYVHVLSEDNSGKTTETISKAIKVQEQLHTHTGDATNGGGCYGSRFTITHSHQEDCYITCPGTLTTTWYGVGWCSWTCNSCGKTVSRYKSDSNVFSVPCDESILNCGKAEGDVESYLWKINCGKEEGVTVDSYNILY